jgi:hypothetical protein
MGNYDLYLRFGSLLDLTMGRSMTERGWFPWHLPVPRVPARRWLW